MQYNVFVIKYVFFFPRKHLLFKFKRKHLEGRLCGAGSTDDRLSEKGFLQGDIWQRTGCRERMSSGTAWGKGSISGRKKSQCKGLVGDTWDLEQQRTGRCVWSGVRQGRMEMRPEGGQGPVTWSL